MDRGTEGRRGGGAEGRRGGGAEGRRGLLCARDSVILSHSLWCARAYPLSLSLVCACIWGLGELEHERFDQLLLVKPYLTSKSWSLASVVKWYNLTSR